MGGGEGTSRTRAEHICAGLAHCPPWWGNNPEWGAMCFRFFRFGELRQCSISPLRTNQSWRHINARGVFVFPRRERLHFRSATDGGNRFSICISRLPLCPCDCRSCVRAPRASTASSAPSMNSLALYFYMFGSVASLFYSVVSSQSSVFSFFVDASVCSAPPDPAPPPRPCAFVRPLRNLVGRAGNSCLPKALPAPKSCKCFPRKL